MARLSGPPDKFIQLDVLGYQFPDRPASHSSNWLVIRLNAADGDRRWSAVFPALVTREVTKLVAWLRALADGRPDIPMKFFGTEPNISFAAVRDGATLRLRVYFWTEFRPPHLPLVPFNPPLPQPRPLPARRPRPRRTGPPKEFGGGWAPQHDDSMIELRPDKEALRRFAAELEAILTRFPVRPRPSQSTPDQRVEQKDS